MASVAVERCEFDSIHLGAIFHATMRPYFMVGNFLRPVRVPQNECAALVGQALLPVRFCSGNIHPDSQESVLPHFPHCARACSCCCTCFFSACISSGFRNVIRATFRVLEYGRITCIDPPCSRMEK